MELIIHCGDGKTGTSSIQNHLFGRSQELMEHGILYHTSRKSGGHFNFKYLAGRRSRVASDQHAALEQEVRADVDAIRRKLIEHQPGFVLLSSESFFSLPMEDLQKIIDHLDASFSRIHCIMYIRDPVKHYLSFIQQQIKASSTFISPYQFTRNLYDIACRWRDFVTPENMHLHIFDRKALLHGNVISDFLRLISEITKIEIGAAPAESINVSISAEQMILLQEFRRDFLPDMDNCFDTTSNQLLTFFQNICENGDLPVTRPELKPVFKDVLRTRNLQTIRDIDRDFGTNMETTFWGESREIPEIPDNAPVSEIADLLTAYDVSVYNLLKYCIPQYQNAAGFKSVLSKKVMNDPLVRENQGFKTALKRYVAKVDAKLAKEIEDVLST